MASEDLDNFFAKKDKGKKSKSKSKFTTGELFAKQKKETKLGEKKKKENETQEYKPTSSEKKAESDEDWNEVKDEEVDLSGLKVKELQMSSREDADSPGDKDSDAESVDEDGERKGKPGVWDTSDSAPVKVHRAEPKPKPAPPPPEPESDGAGPKKYVPPGVRAAAAAGLNPSSLKPTVLARKKRTAPNLRSEEDFPTLGGESRFDADYENNKSLFETVGRSRGAQEQTKQQYKDLELGNKFGALSNN